MASSNRYFVIIYSGVSCITGTCGIFIGQFYGANQPDKVKESFRISLWLSALLTIPFFLAAFLWPQKIVAFFIDDAAIIDVGVRYMRIMSISYLPLCISSSISSAMRSIGKPKATMQISGLCMAIKIILNIWLIFGGFGLPAMGIEGAALATLMTRFLEMFCYLIALKLEVYAFKTGILELGKVSLPLLKSIVLKAVPFYVNDLLWSASNSVILKCFGQRGEMNYSAYAIASTILDIFYMLYGGLGMAVSVLVSLELGKGKLEESKQCAYQSKGFTLIAAFIFCGLMALTYLIIPSLYSGSSHEEICIAQRMLLLLTVAFFFYQQAMGNYFIFKAGGETKSIVIMDAVVVWVVQIPMLLIASSYTNLSIYGLIGLCVLSELIKWGVSEYLFKKGYWLNNLTKAVC